ncbi:hypothetical protein [Sphaerisporangium corydalis]|uniref:DUF4190 domain-containing protein n=1 Tax=Sphaerisporangium corydalis TaxID=1441875 RepID=A0ABV9ER20_9ACTN|nr:hypothetical protein [Sphaerisporangium corydalis]
MSSGPPEQSGQDPKDWQSPYGPPGGHDAYGDRPPDGEPYGGGAQSPYDQRPYDRPPAGSPYDQDHSSPYDQPHDRQGYAQPTYDQQGYPPQQGYAPQEGYPPPGQNPYAAGYDPSYGTPSQGPYGQPGYGQQGYGQPYGYGPPYGYPPRPPADSQRTHAIVALVISLVLAMSCYVSLGGIAGAILAGIALGKADTDPPGARSLLKWCWISIGINVVLLVGGIATIIIIGVTNS